MSDISAVDAVRKNDIESVTRWLTDGGDPDTADAEGWTPLLVASARGNAAMVDLLLWHNIEGAKRASPDVRFPGADGLPIYMAGQSGDVATVKSLLQARPGHVFEIASVNGHTVFLQAAFYGQKPHQQLASYLLEEIGAILSTPGEQDIAAARRRMFTATNVRGQNPLELAKAYGIQPMIELLAAYDETTPADRAPYTQRLLEQIAPPPPANEEERRLQALTDQLIDCIQTGLDQTLAPADAGAPGAEEERTIASVTELLGNDALEINRLGGPLQRTPLIIACTGADVNPTMNRLRTAIVDLLLPRGADPLVHEVHAMGVNAVVRAAVWGHFSILERFAARLSAQALADALNEKPAVNGFTALHDSVLRGLSATGELLAQYLAQIDWAVRHGARHDIEDHSGRTQEAIAREALDDPDFSDNARKIIDALLGESVPG